MNQKEYLKLYKGLPKELQKLLSSDKLLDDLERICEKYDIIQYLYEINDYTGNVLLGMLPPNEFEDAIKDNLKLSPEKAKKITREINRFVFYPVKSLLENLYNMEIAPIAKMKRKPSLSKQTIKKDTEKESETKEKEKPKKQDTYREPIE